MPPVLHIALDELPRGGALLVGAGQLRLRGGERQHVLQLIAKAEGAARLVEAGAGPDAARQRLIEQPAIDQQVEGRIRRRDLDRAEQRVPVTPTSRSRPSNETGEPLDQPQRVGPWRPWPSRNRR
jgi:hypothetical protein